MNLSNSGRVVVIDDNFDEIKNLLNSLGKQAVPYLYYDGSMDNLPDEPLEGIRFIFLDIELQDTKGKDEKNQASVLIAILKKIISTLNGPYVIGFWTKHIEVINYVIENCTIAKIPPVAYVDLGKPSTVDTEEWNVEKISDKIKLKLSNIGAFQLYVEWENVLHSSSNKFINDFASLIPYGTDWSPKTSSLFYKLYKAYVDKNVFDDQAEQFKCACLLMNLSFSDVLHRFSFENLKLPDGFKLSNDEIDLSIISKLNTSLFLSNNLLKRPSTGYLYYCKNQKLLDTLAINIFKENKKPDSIKLCKAIITPECDLAQNKVLKYKDGNIEKKFQRIIFGILFNHNEDYKNILKSGDAHFQIGPFWFNDQIQIIVFHFLSITFEDENNFDKPFLSLKRDMLFDIQSKAANHVNRLGNFQLTV